MKPSGEKTNFAESFAHAFDGIKAAAKGRNFRIQAAVALVAIVLGLIFRVSAIEWLAIIFCIGAVLGAECINTAVEDMVDLSVKTFHPQAKRAKDVAAGGVLVFSAASLIIGMIIFIPKIFGF
ncbi:MAG: diacylglycerol kinase family protein [Eggerthellaceae bacterium]|nr:diacylglycerol kinase family protein [Eggerthellaceae bacterium]